MTIPVGYVIATDDDFSGTTDGTFKYIGTDEYVIIPNVIKGVAVTSYKSMFSGYTGLQLKGVASFNKNVTNMHSMFYNLQATTLDLSYFDTSNVIYMSHMFEYSKVTTLDLSNFDTSNVIDMSHMFVYAEVTSLDLSSFDTFKVTDMNRMFLAVFTTTLDLSSFDTSNVTDMDYMFFYAETKIGYARTQVDVDNFNYSAGIPSGLTFYVKPAPGIRARLTNEGKLLVSNEIQEGNNILSLHSLNGDILKLDEIIEGDKVSLQDGVLTVKEIVEYMNIVEDGHYPVNYVLATDDDFSGTTNGDFRYIGTALKVVIPRKIKGIAVTSYSNMFNSDTGKLVEGVVSNNSNVTDMRSMFEYSQATTINVSSFDTSNVTDMSYMFEYSQAISLDLSSFDTSNVTNMYGMFRNSQVTSLDLSSFDTSNVTSMSNMFAGSQATTGYASTQADADKFNASSNKPVGLVFVVKP